MYITRYCYGESRIRESLFVDLRENPCSWTLAKLFVRALFTTHFCSLKQAHNFSQQCFVTVGICLGHVGGESAQALLGPGDRIGCKHP